MSKDIFTFYNYLNRAQTAQTTEFLTLFGNRVSNLPETVMSSRQIMKLLDIRTRHEFTVFKGVFTDYYKMYLDTQKTLTNVPTHRNASHL